MGVKRFLSENKIRLTNDSVDSQIDSVLLGYQNTASVEEDDLYEEGYTMPDNWKKILGEKEEGEMVQPTDIMSVGDDLLKVTVPSDPRNIKIDLDSFCQDVANLYNGFENLLNIKPVIVNRAKKILEKGYSQDVVVEFLEILDREFGITLEGDKEDEVPSAPAGGSAGPISS